MKENRFGTGLGKYRRNLVMFRELFLWLFQMSKQPETFKDVERGRRTQTKQIKGQKENKE